MSGSEIKTATISLAILTYLAFYDAVSFENWGPHVSLAALKAGDQIIATLFAVSNDNCYCLVMHSFDLALASLSPGIRRDR